MFNELKMRQLQKRANAFVKSLDGKSDKEVEQAYLDNKEFTNNEIVLSFLFFKYPSLIRILPLDFQKSRINSNLSMFRSGSIEARKSLVSDWIRDNKFFMNATSIGMDDSEYNSYLKLYFNQKDDIVKLFMDDLRRVVSILYSEDARETEKLISMEASKFTSKQWEFIIKAEPSLIKYAPQDVQNMYSLDEKYIKYINGEAKQKYIDEQVKKIREDNTLLNDAPIDVKCEYINRYPFMINYISSSSLIELLKYDITFIRYININLFKRDEDKSIEIIYEILSGIENKSILEYAYLNSYYGTGLKNLVDRAILTYGKENKIDEYFNTIIPRDTVAFAAKGLVYEPGGVVVHEDGTVTYISGCSDSPERVAEVEAELDAPQEEA